MGCDKCDFAELCEILPEDMSCEDIRRYAEVGEAAERKYNDERN